jgi:DNA-binding SARP family transcriptional activator/tetratricopeptide (TPR) repeat protein
VGRTLVAPQTDPREWRFEILGRVKVLDGAREFDLGPPRQVAVFVTLLLNRGYSVSRHELARRVWGLDAPPSARNLVATYVCRLRKILEPQRRRRSPGTTLVSTADGYRLLAPKGSIDALVFEEKLASARSLGQGGDLAGAAALLEEAMALWRGPQALEGASGPYAEAVRGRWAEHRLAATEELLDIRLSLGRNAECVGELTALAAAYPYRERIRAMLMLALYRTGRQAEALASYHSFRHALVKEAGLDPGREIQRLHARILGADPTLDAAQAPPARPAQQPARVPEAVPAQLPMDITDFTGRQDQVEAICRTVRDDRAAGVPGVRLVTISGSGGIGKTTLALHAAHLLWTQFPDGQIFLDMMGVRDSARSPEDAIRSVLVSLGAEPSRLPADLEGCTALYRTLTSGRRMLVVLDDARDAAQIRPLLPGSADCVVLVTSRVRLTDLPGSQLFDLSPLSAVEGRQLLERIVGAAAAEEKTAADLIVEACGGLPLALRIVAARALYRPPGTLSRLAARLSDETRRLSELAEGELAVSRCFQLGYDNMLTGDYPGELAHLFRLLCTLDVAYFGIEEATAAAGLPPERTEALLDAMCRLHLLEQTAEDRFAFHGLLRLFGRERCAQSDPPGASAQAVKRIFAYHARMVACADGVMQPRRLGAAPSAPSPFADSRTAIAWLEEHLPAIVAIVRQSAQEAVVSATDLARFLTGMRGFLHQRGHWLDWERLAETSQAMAAREEDTAAAAVAELELGTLATVRGRLDESLDRLRGSVALFAEVGDPIGKSRALNNFSVTLTELDRHDEAEAALNEALGIQEAADDERGACISLNNLVRLMLNRKEYVQALQYAQQCITRTVTANMPNLTAIAHNMLGLVHHAEGRYAEAFDAQAACLNLSRDLGDRVREAFALGDLSDACRENGRPEEAASWAQQAATLWKELNDPRGEALALERIGLARQSAGESERARELWELAIATLNDLDHDVTGRLRDRLREL